MFDGAVGLGSSARDSSTRSSSNCATRCGRASRAVGERISTESELASTLGVGRNTVARPSARSPTVDCWRSDRATARTSGRPTRCPARCGGCAGARLRRRYTYGGPWRWRAARLAATGTHARTNDTLTRLLDEHDGTWSRGDVEASARCRRRIPPHDGGGGPRQSAQRALPGLMELVAASVATTSDTDVPPRTGETSRHPRRDRRPRPGTRRPGTPRTSSTTSSPVTSAESPAGPPQPTRLSPDSVCRRSASWSSSARSSCCQSAPATTRCGRAAAPPC